MRALLRHSGLRIAVCLLYALAMGLMVNGHSTAAIASNAASEIDLSGYTLPDGSTPVLCLDASGLQQDGGTILAYGFCEACRLTGAPGLPAFTAESTLGRRCTESNRSYPVTAEDLPEDKAFGFSRARSPPRQNFAKTSA